MHHSASLPFSVYCTKASLHCYVFSAASFQFDTGPSPWSSQIAVTQPLLQFLKDFYAQKTISTAKKKQKPRAICLLRTFIYVKHWYLALDANKYS